MASVAHGKRTIHRNRKCDFEQRTHRVELPFASPGSETMEMECVTLGTPDIDVRQFPNVDILRIELELPIQSDSPDESPELARMAIGSQMPRRQKGRGTSPSRRALED